MKHLLFVFLSIFFLSHAGNVAAKKHPSHHHHHEQGDKTYRHSFATHLKHLTSITESGTHDANKGDLEMCKKALRHLSEGAGLPVHVTYYTGGRHISYVKSSMLDLSAALHPAGLEGKNAYYSGADSFKSEDGHGAFNSAKHDDYKLRFIWVYPSHNHVKFVFSSGNNQCVLSNH